MHALGIFNQIHNDNFITTVKLIKYLVYIERETGDYK